ncbi:MAG: class I SAM-dependent methyltransferase [Candidatus Omnitrophica bacterium]|nr:class I SAM-dependent methyltransferase [Candidatus Omnitrophota bacterium]
MPEMWDKDGERLILERKVLENHKQYLERKKLYQSHGFDIDEERKFIFNKAEPLSGDILEVGTGKGHFALTLAKEGYKFISVDISEEEQNVARLNLRYFGLEKSVDFRIENAEKLSFEDEIFDIIFSINTIHHFKRSFKVMDEIMRVASFDGKIIMSDFTPEGFRILDKIHASDGRIHEKAGATLNDIKEYFRSKRLKINYYKSQFQETLVAHKQIA